MQKSNSLLVVCAAATAVCLLPLARAADTDAQAKAREAMRQKLAEIQGQPATPAATAAPAAQPAPAPASAPAPVKPSITPVVPAPAPAKPLPAADSASIEKAREAMRQKMNEVVAQQAAGTFSAPLRTDSEAAAKAREAMRQKVSETQAEFGYSPIVSPVVLPPRDSDTATKERAAMRQKEDQFLSRGQMPTRNPAPFTPTVKQTAAAQPGANYLPLEGPALPISTDQQQRLQELLQKYRADEITPEQYHEQRAKILGQK